MNNATFAARLHVPRGRDCRVPSPRHALGSGGDADIAL
jgi:hypothetical protein